MTGEDQMHFEVARLLKRLRGLSEKAHKQTAIKEFFEQNDDEVFEEFIYMLIRATQQGLKKDPSDILIIVAEFVVGLPEEDKSTLAAAAYEKKHIETFNFFSAPSQSIPRLSPNAKILKGKDGKPLTLGERKSFARNPRKNLLAKLLQDPSPEVIQNLLGGPRITEKDVIRIASLRPVQPEILEVIFSSSRWVSSYRVKVTLVSNPYLPPEIGIKIVPSLLKQDIRSLSNDNLIHPEIRRAMKQMLDGEGEISESDIMLEGPPGPDNDEKAPDQGNELKN